MGLCGRLRVADARLSGRRQGRIGFRHGAYGGGCGGGGHCRGRDRLRSWGVDTAVGCGGHGACGRGACVVGAVLGEAWIAGSEISVGEWGFILETQVSRGQKARGEVMLWRSKRRMFGGVGVLR